MLTGQRVIFSDNGTLVDYSRQLGDLFNQNISLTVVAAQDKMFVGGDQPFNHRYVKVHTPNANASVLSVDIWNGSAWVPAVDVLDGTSSGGKTFAQTGIIQWTTDRNKGWSRQADSNDVTGLAGTRIYDMFWVRFSYSADTSAKQLAYMGHNFSDDNLLGGYYPDLVRSKLIASWESGKADWVDQHILAAEELIRDLRERRYVVSGNQVFDWELFSVPAMHKCANIIMAGLGPDYVDRAIEAQEAYQNELENTMAGLDRNRDGRLSLEERKPAVGLRRV